MELRVQGRLPRDARSTENPLAALRDNNARGAGQQKCSNRATLHPIAESGRQSRLAAQFEVGSVDLVCPPALSHGLDDRGSPPSNDTDPLQRPQPGGGGCAGDPGSAEPRFSLARELSIYSVCVATTAAATVVIVIDEDAVFVRSVMYVVLSLMGVAYPILLLWDNIDFTELRATAKSYSFVASLACLLVNLALSWSTYGRFPFEATMLLVAITVSFLHFACCTVYPHLMLAVLALSLLAFGASTIVQSLTVEDTHLFDVGKVQYTHHSILRAAFITLGTIVVTFFFHAISRVSGRSSNPLLAVPAMQYEPLAEEALQLPQWWLTRLRGVIESERRLQHRHARSIPASRADTLQPQGGEPRASVHGVETECWRLCHALASLDYAAYAARHWNWAIARRSRWSVLLSGIALLSFISQSLLPPCQSVAGAVVTASMIPFCTFIIFWRNTSHSLLGRCVRMPNTVATLLWLCVVVYLELMYEVDAHFVESKDDMSPSQEQCSTVSTLLNISALTLCMFTAVFLPSLQYRVPKLEGAITLFGLTSQVQNVVLYTFMSYTDQVLISLPLGGYVSVQAALRTAFIQMGLCLGRFTAASLRETARHRKARGNTHLARTFVNRALYVARPRPHALDSYVVELVRDLLRHGMSPALIASLPSDATHHVSVLTARFQRLDTRVHHQRGHAASAQCPPAEHIAHHLEAAPPPPTPAPAHRPAAHS